MKIYIDSGINVWGTGGAGKIAISSDGQLWDAINMNGTVVTHTFMGGAGNTVMGCKYPNLCEIRIKNGQQDVRFDIQDVKNQSTWQASSGVTGQAELNTALKDINSWS